MSKDIYHLTKVLQWRIQGSPQPCPQTANYLYRPQTKFGARQCFHRCLSVHGGGGLPSQHASQVTWGGGVGQTSLGLPTEGDICIWAPPPSPRYMGYYGIRSTSVPYASYWNAFLFPKNTCIRIAFVWSANAVMLRITDLLILRILQETDSIQIYWDTSNKYFFINSYFRRTI